MSYAFPITFPIPMSSYFGATLSLPSPPTGTTVEVGLEIVSILYSLFHPSNPCEVGGNPNS